MYRIFTLTLVYQKLLYFDQLIKVQSVVCLPLYSATKCVRTNLFLQQPVTLQTEKWCPCTGVINRKFKMKRNGWQVLQEVLPNLDSPIWYLDLSCEVPSVAGLHSDQIFVDAC